MTPKPVPLTLLQTIQSDSSLQSQLAQLPVDSKTMTLSVQLNQALIDHPDLRDVASQAETIDLPLESTKVVAPIDMGFVPRRHIEMLGQARNPDAEYRIVGRLGSGGTGIVYQAHQRAIDREVAVKVLRDELALDPQSRNRFLTEARVIGGLDHPNVIALHELCIDDTGGLFYSMKRIDGTSWNHRIGEMSLVENLETLSRVADAIRYAHSRGLIHRDIKPENVMLGRFGEVLVADWGLAISHSGNQRSPHTDSTIGGTPAYMAPELAMGDTRAIGLHTDVYLLGAVLFHILTGYPPHHGENLLLCIHSAAQNEIRPTRVEGELVDIAMKAMATRPSDRYTSVDEFIAALDDQRQHEQSVRLVRRAKQRLETSTVDNHYESFRVADALLREAIEVWPANKRAHDAIKQLQLDFARAAASQGDLDLALSLYESGGEGNSEAAARVRRLRDERNQNGRLESRYSTLFTHSPEAGLLTQLTTGVVIESNDMFKQLFGYRDEEIVGHKMSELNIWACPERRKLFVERLRGEGLVDNFEAPLLHKDGRRIHTLISGRATRVHGEELVVSTIRDISLRKEAENELKRSRQRLRDLQRLAGLGTWSYDMQTDEVYWSEETYQILKVSHAEAHPGKDLYRSLLHPSDLPLFEQALTSSIENGAAYELPLRHRMPSGDYQTLVVRGQPIFDDAGKTIEMYGVILRPHTKPSPSVV